jgi:chitinase
VQISPLNGKVKAGNALDFSADVTGSADLEVMWSVQEGDAGGRVVSRGAKAAGGKVSAVAVYIAPKSPGIYHVIAASKADSRKTAVAEVAVVGR